MSSGQGAVTPLAGSPAEDRATRIARVVEIDALARERHRLASSLVADLATYQRLIADHDLGIVVPCGFRPSDHRSDRRDDAIFWRLARIDTGTGHVHFQHDCGPDHYAGGLGPYEKTLQVPILFFTHPGEWLTLTALAGHPAY